jgi:hypothetical protein
VLGSRRCPTGTLATTFTVALEPRPEVAQLTASEAVTSTRGRRGSIPTHCTPRRPAARLSTWAPEIRPDAIDGSNVEVNAVGIEYNTDT